MSLAQVFKHIVDALWDLGGIGAAADLGLEHFGPEGDGLGLGEGCPVQCASESTPLKD